MKTLPRILVLLPALLAFGCLAPKGNLGEYTASDGGETDGATGDDTTTADAGTTVESETGPDEPPPACAEPGDPTSESAEFLFDPPLAGEGFAGECQVSAIDTDPDGTEVALTCGEQSVQLHLQLDEPLTQFAVGDPLALDYRLVQSFGISEWFTLRLPGPDGALLLGGVQAEDLAPPNADQFFAPLSMTRQDGVCMTTIDCDHLEEPIAVEFKHGDDTAVVFALHSAVIGETYRVGASTARKHYSEAADGLGGFCQVFDVPEYYYRLMFHRLGE